MTSSSATYGTVGTNTGNYNVVGTNSVTTFGGTSYNTVTIADYGNPIPTTSTVKQFSLNQTPLIRTDPNKVLGEDSYHQGLFWKHFAHRNWKQQVVEAEGWGGSIMLIKLCSECENPVFSHALHAVEDDEKAKQVVNHGLREAVIHVEKYCTGAVNEEA